MRAYTHTHARTHARTRARAYTHTLTHTHTHARTHAHTRSLVIGLDLNNVTVHYKDRAWLLVLVLTSAVHTARTEPGHCRVWLLSLLVTVTSGYCHFCTHYGSPDLGSAHSKDRDRSLSCLVTVTYGYCHVWSLLVTVTSGHFHFWLLSLSLLVTVTSGHCHFRTHHGILTSAVHTLRTEPGHCHFWLLSLLVTVTSVHTTGVLTLAVHTLKTEPGHCNFCTHHGSPDLSSAHYKGQSLVTVTTGYCPFCTHHGSLVTVTFGYCHFWLLSFLYTPRES